MQFTVVLPDQAPHETRVFAQNRAAGSTGSIAAQVLPAQRGGGVAQEAPPARRGRTRAARGGVGGRRGEGSSRRRALRARGRHASRLSRTFRRPPRTETPGVRGGVFAVAATRNVSEHLSQQRKTPSFQVFSSRQRRFVPVFQRKSERPRKRKPRDSAKNKKALGIGNGRPTGTDRPTPNANRRKRRAPIGNTRKPCFVGFECFRGVHRRGTGTGGRYVNLFISAASAASSSASGGHSASTVHPTGAR